MLILSPRSHHHRRLRVMTNSPMLRLCPWTRISGACNPLIPIRTFTQTPALPAKPLPPRLQIHDADVTISYLKGTGPGGQKIVRGRSQPNAHTKERVHSHNAQNKTNSAVQIIHKPSGVVIKCQATRSRSQNEKIARQLLADKVEQQEKGEDSRVAMKAEAARKKKASKVKKARRKYRSLEQEGEEGTVGNGEEQDDDETGTSDKSPSST